MPEICIDTGRPLNLSSFAYWLVTSEIFTPVSHRTAQGFPLLSRILWIMTWTLTLLAFWPVKLSLSSIFCDLVFFSCSQWWWRGECDPVLRCPYAGSPPPFFLLLPGGFTSPPTWPLRLRALLKILALGLDTVWERALCFTLHCELSLVSALSEFYRPSVCFFPLVLGGVLQLRYTPFYTYIQLRYLVSCRLPWVVAP